MAVRAPRFDIDWSSQDMIETSRKVEQIMTNKISSTEWAHWMHFLSAKHGTAMAEAMKEAVVRSYRTVLNEL